MKKWIVNFSLLAVAASAPLFSDAAPAPSQTTPQCSQLTADEMSFSNHLTDMGNKAVFCSQFTPAQRQQAMQMMGQNNPADNSMSADQAVQQVMQSGNPTTAPAKPRGAGGCPVKQ
jgi:hypothetical protein